MKKNYEFHGSDLELIQKTYGISPENIISFSDNVNPLGLSPLFKKSLRDHIDSITAYPDRNYALLKKAIGDYCHVSPGRILVGSGATDLISRFIKFIAPRQALVVNPTYSEYAREIRLTGGQVLPFFLEESNDFCLDLYQLTEALHENLDLLILCNPNNPTGSSIHRSDLALILSACEARDINVLVDETYIEFSHRMDELTAIPLTEHFDNLFVVRGVSKFFSAPGLRLGYAITGNGPISQHLCSDNTPWGLNTYAAICAPEMFRDDEYIRKTRDYIHKEMSRVTERLKTNESFRLHPPSANFLLLKIVNPSVTSEFLFDAAIKEGMMIRDCASFPGLGNNFIRFCLRHSEDNQKLLDLLFSIMTCPSESPLP